MTKRFWVTLALMLGIVALSLTVSCAKKKIGSEPGMGLSAEDEAAAARRRAAEQESAMQEQRLREERLREEARARQGGTMTDRDAFLNENIYFNFDEATLLPEAKAILQRKADWLNAHPDVTVVVEGHCDERGTTEYNLALGDRRARTTKTYLVDLGIAARRMQTVSYGEEQPIDPGHNEDAWAKNRRAQFVLN